MFDRLLLGAGLVALAACNTTAPTASLPQVDPEAAARAAANPPQQAAVLSALEPLEGSELSPGLVLNDARAGDGRVIMDLSLSDDSAIDTPAKRAAFIEAFQRDFGLQMCAAPALRSYIATRGGFAANVRTAAGDPLVSRVIDSC
ncbi:hypothetical protein [Palleronia pelagia]|uniref:Lipoprotein n=1 Tax=Palleronia pelagia TaxID=387096 RepID=A0A1H8LRV9_9RHOB|nr:hypothetical protein [Palleronia pelagia]SEO07831.1 hypothetical protein SAMN04488011_11165 [Palleronia pelagia]